MATSLLEASQNEIWTSAFTSTTPAQMEQMQNFFKDAVTLRIPSRKLAAQTLHRIGKPPSSSPDVSNPIGPARDVLDVFAFLARRLSPENGTYVRGQITAYIKQNLSSYIGPWIDFLLEKFVLGKEPRTIAGLDFRDNILNILPLFLAYPSTPSELAELKSAVPKLTSSLLGEIWLDGLESLHITWLRWNTLIGSIFFKESNELTEDFISPLMNHYSSITSCARLAVQHLRRIAGHLPRMGHWELRSVNASLLMIGCLNEKHASFLPALVHGSIPAVVRLLSVVLSRYKRLQQEGISPSTWGILGTTFGYLISSLTNMLKGSLWVSQALDAGVVQMCLKTDRMLPSHKRRKHIDLFAHVWKAIGLVLRQITLHFVYPSVLVRFTASMNRVAELGLEKQLEANARDWPLWEKWQACKAKANDYRSTLNLLKMGPAPICCFKKCPTYGAWPGPRLLRCSACLNPVYCSRECAQKHWRAEHRNVCHQYARDVKDGIPSPSYMDTRFFEMILSLHVEGEMKEIRERLAGYDAKHAAGTALTKRPFLLVNYNTIMRTTEMPEISMAVVDMKSMMESNEASTVEGMKLISPTLLASLRGARRPDFVILALFPLTLGRPEKFWSIIRTA
ncbi:mynd zinc finger domain-like protein [Moniliophthora roreri MCA 2997]|uniref:Mynd zinc finger domain-like protein n=1 Tax=Moniliophthora roreri (strain MCA 2997) TaxID=1381753 RepID=V2YG84_MONRO|nr:mynd zinc finger domain-like protein [Moniliophthora roreri MCA 2997]